MMKNSLVLLALSRATIAIAAPGVVSLPYSRSWSEIQKRDSFVDLPFEAESANYIVNITVGLLHSILS
jgi:hypothetical protein